MVASLTGFGRAEKTDAAGRIAVEVKSVNNRYLQLDLHLPYGYGWVEGPVRALVSEKLARGKVSFHLEILDFEPTSELAINRPVLLKLLELQADLEKEIGRPVACSLDGLLALQGVMKVGSGSRDNEAIWARVKPVIVEALDALIANRRREGEFLATDIASRLKKLEELTASFEERLPTIRQAFRERFTARIKELAGQAGFDENRLSTEIALWTDRTDISEEITRLKSHLAEFAAILKRGEPIGRRLDFLLQEINRETNTVGSKIADLEVIRGGLEIKCEIEKIREQAQNLE